MTTEQLILLFHIESLNAANGSLEWGWHTDIDSWNARGIHTPEQFDHYDLVATASDLSKDANGRKTSWPYLESLTNEQLREEITYYGNLIDGYARLQADYEKRIELDKQEHAERVASLLQGGQSVTIGDFGSKLEQALSA